MSVKCNYFLSVSGFVHGVVSVTVVFPSAPYFIVYVFAGFVVVVIVRSPLLSAYFLIMLLSILSLSTISVGEVYMLPSLTCFSNSFPKYVAASLTSASCFVELSL
jgi:hypothetical protein